MRITVCLSALILISQTVWSQPGEFGVRSSIHLHSLVGDDFESPEVGYQVGLTYRTLTDKVSLQLEAIYAQFGSGNAQGSLKLHYLNIPFLIVLNTEKKLNFFVGPEFSVLLNASVDIDGLEDDLTITNSFFSGRASVTGGVAYRLSDDLVADLRLSQGVHNIYDPEEVPDTFYTNSVLSLGIAYFF